MTFGMYAINQIKSKDCFPERTIYLLLVSVLRNIELSMEGKI